MRNALVHDACALGNKVVVAVAEGTSSPAGAEPCWITPERHWQEWQGAMAAVDAVVVVAPETDDELLRLTALAGQTGCRYLGSGLESVRIAGSKRSTARHLAGEGVAVVPTYSSAEFQDLLTRSSPHILADEWVVKPDDGVGGGGCRRVGIAAARELAIADTNLSVQPFVAGFSGSLSILVGQGQTHVLARTHQHLAWHAEDVGLLGLGVNAWDLEWERAEDLAEAVTRALPDLAGFCGIDVLLTDRDELLVVEVNPRVTSSYPALNASLGMNPLALLQDLMVGVVLDPYLWRETCQTVNLKFAVSRSSRG